MAPLTKSIYYESMLITFNSQDKTRNKIDGNRIIAIISFYRYTIYNSKINHLLWQSRKVVMAVFSERSYRKCPQFVPNPVRIHL